MFSVCLPSGSAMVHLAFTLPPWTFIKVFPEQWFSELRANAKATTLVKSQHYTSTSRVESAIQNKSLHNLLQQLGAGRKVSALGSDFWMRWI